MDEAELVELLDSTRSTERADGRQLERRLRGQAEEDATLAGTLVDLLERASLVTLRTLDGRAVSGRLAALGPDWVSVADGAGETYVALRALATVRPAPGERHGIASGDRLRSGRSFQHELGWLAEGRPRVRVVSGGEVVTGELLAAGVDVVSVRVDGDPKGLCYLSASSISLATVLRSG